MPHPTRRVILAIKDIQGNPHDSKTIKPLLEQIQNDELLLPKEVIYDQGGRGLQGYALPLLTNQKLQTTS